MAGKKKAKKAQSNPARGFATTSTPTSKRRDELSPDDALDPDIAVKPSDVAQEPSNNNAKEPSAEAAISDLTPEQLEARFEESELQMLLEKCREKSRKDATRYVSKLKSERRLMRHSAERLWLMTWLTEDSLDAAIKAIKLHENTSTHDEHSSPPRTSLPLSEDEMCIRVWTLKQALAGLDFLDDCIQGALVAILDHTAKVERFQDPQPKDKVWGADECLAYLALSCDNSELPGYDTHRTEKRPQGLQGLSANVSPMCTDSSAPTSTRGSGVATPVEKAPSISTQLTEREPPANEENDGGDESDSDVDPNDQHGKYLELKTRLYHRHPELTRIEPRKSKKPKGRRSPPPGALNKRSSKLQQRIRKIERDMLFDKETAEADWGRLRIRLEAEAAERRRAEQSAQSEQSKPPPAPESAVISNEDAEEDLSQGVGEFFLSLPDQVNGQDQSKADLSVKEENGAIISLRNFGKWTGLSPRRIFDDTCKARDSKVRTNMSLVSATSFSVRHRLTVRWTQSQEIPKHVTLTGVEHAFQSKEFSVEMRGISCPDATQSEAFVSTAALFLIFSSSSKEERVYLRLPSVWRELWTEFSEEKHQQEDAAEREELRDVRELVRTHEAALTAVETRKTRFDSKVSHVSTNDILSAVQETTSTVNISADLANMWIAKVSTEPYQRMLRNRQTLPISAFKDALLEDISSNQVIVLCGETGCGKSTQVPAFILERALSHGRNCKIYCTQPRRISAISLARRVSEELGERRNDLGTNRSLVGYAIRLESRFTAQTRLVYATTGIVMRMLENKNGLDGITHLVVDEVHERTIDSDFLLIVLRKLMVKRPDLKVILMSATVDAEHFSKYFGGAPIFTVPGRTFPVETMYLEDAIELTGYGSGKDAFDMTSIGAQEIEADEESPDEFQQRTPKTELTQYSTRTREVLSQFNEYHLNYELIVRLLDIIATHQRYMQYSKAILVFLPGIGEIRRLNSMLGAHETFADGWMIYPLHSTISTDEQERAFVIPPDGVRKIVLATNIAETGITIPDVTCVIDSGKHREIRFDERRQLSRLLEVFISQANAKQRRGRAGRVQNGLCFHMFSKARHDSIIAPSQTPEMLRLSLQDLALRVKICKLGGIEQILSEALDPPLPKNVRRAVDSLIEVKALTATEELTALGRQLAKLPLDVYLGKLLLLSSIFKCADAGLSIAAILSSKSPFLAPISAQQQARQAHLAFKKGNSDLLTVYNAYCSWRRVCQNNPSLELQYCRKNFLSPQVLSSVEDLKSQLMTTLFEAGFLHFDSADASSKPHSRFHSHKRRFLDVPPGYDRNSGADTIVNSVIAWSFYPKLLMREGKGYRNVANNQSVSLHPSSVNKGSSDPPKFLSFYHIMQSSSKYYNAHETSAVDDLAIALLCGDAESKLYAGVLSIDSNRLRFSLPDWKTMSVLKAWRATFHDIVAQGIESPGKELDDEQRYWLELWQRICSRSSSKK